ARSDTVGPVQPRADVDDEVLLEVRLLRADEEGLVAREPAVARPGLVAARRWVLGLADAGGDVGPVVGARADGDGRALHRRLEVTEVLDLLARIEVRGAGHRRRPIPQRRDVRDLQWHGGEHVGAV